MDRQIEKKFWTGKNIALIVLAALFIAFALQQIFFRDPRSKLNVETAKMSISTVSEGNFDEFIIVNGVVHPLKTIQLDAIVGGYVVQKLVEGGNNVQAGQTVLKLENQNLKLSFLQSETEANRLVNELQNTRQRLKVEKFTLEKTLNELEFNIDQAKDNYERNEKLLKDRIISDQEYLKTKREYEKLVKQRKIEIESQKYQTENAELQIKQLERTLQHTQQNVDLWRQSLDNLLIKAPVTGLLSSIDVEIGSNIAQGQNIGQIDDTNGFKLKAEIDEYYITRIYNGLEGTFEFNNQKYDISIVKIYPEVKNGRFVVDLVLKGNSPQEIRRGQSLPLRIELGKAQKAVLLPTGGFFSDTGGNWVFVVNGDKAEKRMISLGRKNPEFYEVLSGLKVGDKVITSSYANYGDKEVLMLDKEANQEIK
jgi:HlyD family secretion protein